MKTLTNTIFKVDHTTKHIDIALLLMRVAIAFMMFAHGFPKIERLGTEEIKFLNFMGLGPEASLYLAIFAEIVCSGFILFGLGTRLAVIPLLITMLVVVFLVHWGEPFLKYEVVFHYLLTYFVLLIMGSGKYSFDYYFFIKNK